MNLTVVGCSGSFPGPDNPASCYLVEADGYRVLLDLGNGAFGYLARHIDVNDVDAVLLSHLHPDHCLDLCSMYVARTYHPRGALPKVAVYGPRGTAKRLAAAYRVESDSGLGDVYDFVEWDTATSYEIGPLSVRVANVTHPVAAYALRIAHGDKVLVYSGDTGPCEALVGLARDADLLLCEASFLAGGEHAADVHLTGCEAGEHAARAGVRRLVVTHVPPWYDPRELVAEAQRTYAGPTEAARAGAQYQL